MVVMPCFYIPPTEYLELFYFVLEKEKAALAKLLFYGQWRPVLRTLFNIYYLLNMLLFCKDILLITRLRFS